MFENLSGDDIVAQILMEFVGRKASERNGREICAFLVVEGADDMRLLQFHVNPDYVSIIPGNGKFTVTEAIEAVNSESYDINIVGLIDRDGDELGSELDNLVQTEFYDLDAEIITHSRVLERVFSNHCQKSEFLKSDSRNLLNRINLMVRDISLLRVVVKQMGWNFSVRNLSLGYLYDARTGLVDRGKLFSKLVASETSVTSSEAEKELVKVLEARQDWSRLVSGHDIAKGYAILLRIEGGVSMKPEVIERILRSSLWPAEFRSTSVFKSLDYWADGRGLSLWDAAWLNVREPRIAVVGSIF